MHWIQFSIVIAGIWAMHRENQKESKDFHGRLCDLQEKYIQIMKQFLERK